MPSVSKDVQRLGVQWWECKMENSLAMTESNTHPPYDPDTALLGSHMRNENACPYKDLHRNVCSNS